MTDCNVIGDLMPLYADGQASEATVRLMESHTARCPHCRAMLQHMTAPMEPQQTDPQADFAKLLRRQRRKIAVRVLLICLVMALVWGMVWWIGMERSFDGREIRVVTTDGDKILSQVPQLALTDAELELADQILTLPDAETAFRLIVPENALQTSVFAIQDNPAVEYCTDELRFILEFIDADRNGTVDLIRKTAGVLSKDGTTADTVYVLEHYPVTGRTYWEKLRSRHVLFGFLNQP